MSNFITLRLRIVRRIAGHASLGQETRIIASVYMYIETTARPRLIWVRNVMAWMRSARQAIQYAMEGLAIREYGKKPNLRQSTIGIALLKNGLLNESNRRAKRISRAARAGHIGKPFHG